MNYKKIAERIIEEYDEITFEREDKDDIVILMSNFVFTDYDIDVELYLRIGEVFMMNFTFGEVPYNTKNLELVNYYNEKDAFSFRTYIDNDDEDYITLEFETLINMSFVESEDFYYEQVSQYLYELLFDEKFFDEINDLYNEMNEIKEGK